MSGRPVSYSFAALFLIGGLVPNPLDIKFKSISGLGSEIETDDVPEGGENLFMHNIPKRVKHENVTLERGLVVGSLLNIEFNAAMNFMKFLPSNILITALDKDKMPIPGANWLLIKAYPVKWDVSKFDAGENALIIDTLELTYAKLMHIRI